MIISDFVYSIVHLLQNMGLFGAFLSMFIENLGVPLPTEIGYLIGQDLINTAKSNYFVVLLILTLGHVLGATISYFIGKAGDGFVAKRLHKSSRIMQVQEVLAKWYAKYGTVTVLITRFVGYVRPWSSFVAGFAKVPFKPFLLWTTVGSLFFNIIALYFSKIIILIWRKYADWHFWILIVLGCLFFAYFIYILSKTLFRKNRK